MQDTIEKFINKIVFSSQNEHFLGGALKKVSSSKLEMFSLFLSILIVQTILLFAGKYLWNMYLVPAVTTINPIKSVWDLVAISLLLKLLF